MGRYQIVRSTRHATVIMRAAIEDVRALQVGDAYQGEIGGSLHIITVGRSLGHAVEADTVDLICAASMDHQGRGKDDRRNTSLEFPISLGNRGIIELDIVREVCEEDLSSRQNEHVSDTGTIDWRVRRTGNLVQLPAVPLKEKRGRIAEARASHHEHFVVRLP